MIRALMLIAAALMLIAGCSDARGATTVVTASMTQAQIQAAINSAAMGDTIVFSQGGGTYSISGQLTLKCGVTYTGSVTNSGLVLASASAGPSCNPQSFWSLTTTLPTPTSTYLVGQRTMGNGTSETLVTEAVYADGSQGIIAAQSYASTNHAVCTVTNAGLVDAVGAGTCQVSSVADGVTSGRLTITVQ